LPYGRLPPPPPAEGWLAAPRALDSTASRPVWPPRKILLQELASLHARGGPLNRCGPFHRRSPLPQRSPYHWGGPLNRRGPKPSTLALARAVMEPDVQKSGHFGAAKPRCHPPRAPMAYRRGAPTGGCRPHTSAASRDFPATNFPVADDPAPSRSTRDHANSSHAPASRQWATRTETRKHTRLEINGVRRIFGYIQLVGSVGSISICPGPRRHFPAEWWGDYPGSALGPKPLNGVHHIVCWT